MSRVEGQSSEADIEALEALCDRLAGFGADVALDWVDGFMAALVCGPRVVLPSEWLPVMFGDAFDRAFADPADVQQAMDALMKRWNVLASQLDPEALIDEPEQLRLAPLMMLYDEAIRQEMVDAGHIGADEVQAMLQTGLLWAEGFMAAIDAFDGGWPEPDIDTEEGRWYDDCLMRVIALTLDARNLAEHLAANYPGETIERDQLVDEAVFGVQDLRLYWLDHAPKPPPRRVEPVPGRNDPCPCGSGKKFKKCHGAASSSA